MQSIFSSDSNYRTVYWLIWISLGLLYCCLLIFVWSIEWQLALVDAVVFTLLFAVMGVAVWYIVRFSDVDSANLFNTIISHIIAGALLVFTVVLIAESVIPLVYPAQADSYTISSEYHIYRLVIGGLLYILTAVNFYLIVYYEEYRSRKLREQELDTHLKSAELNLLKAQINPHFIFNSLNSVSSLTLTDPGKAHEMVIQLADFLRYSIRKDADQLELLAKEIEAIELFLAIEKTRYGDRLDVELDCSKEIADKTVPALILQPLIENAIKYSLHETDIASAIKLECGLDGSMLVISISNNYDKSSVVRKGEGIGLKNVKARLGLVYGRYDLLEIIDADDMFTVKIKFPQNQ